MSTTRTSNAPSTRTRIAVRVGIIALSLAASGALTYRVIRASESGWFEAATSLGTGLLVATTITAGWILDARKILARAQSAEWEAAHLRRQDTLLDGDEDRALWDSVEPATVDHDTCAFGLNVVAINQWRNIPRAG